MMTDLSDWIEATIARAGHAVIAVGPCSDDDLPGFSYSVGLQRTALGCEFIIAGLPRHLAGQLINDLAEKFRENPVPVVSGMLITEILTTYPLLLRVVERDVAEATAFAAVKRAGAKLRLVQMVLPDKNGHFPGDPSCDHRFALAQDLNLHVKRTLH